MDLETWNWKSIDVVNAHVRRRDLLNEAIWRGLELVRLGRIRQGRLVTHRFQVEELDRAIRGTWFQAGGIHQVDRLNDDDDV